MPENDMSNSQALLNLVSDEKFEEIESLSNKPNLFKIVGRTHTETWHSMFLGWLLDPNGSHGLDDFPLKRLLYTCTIPVVSGENSDFDKIARFASLGNLNNAQVFPSESNQNEYVFKYNNIQGRLDVFIMFDETDFEGEEVIILIEQKVGAKLCKDQCQRYINWLQQEYAGGFIIPIFLSPSDQLVETSESTFGSPEWYGIDYQKLHDIVLVPALNNSKLNSDSRYLIEQYINNLRIPIGTNKLAMTEDEKELALDLYEKHRRAFDIIQAALGEQISPLINRQTNTVVLKVTINNEEIFGNTVKEFYTKVLEYLIDNEIDLEKYVPFATGTTRYLISTGNTHQNGNEFVNPINIGDYYMETNKSRLGGFNDMHSFLLNIEDIEVEVIEKEEIEEEN